MPVAGHILKTRFLGRFNHSSRLVTVIISDGLSAILEGNVVPIDLIHKRLVQISPKPLSLGTVSKF